VKRKDLTQRKRGGGAEGAEEEGERRKEAKKDVEAKKEAEQRKDGGINPPLQKEGQPMVGCPFVLVIQML
jgi:hypothetical protein